MSCRRIMLMAVALAFAILACQPPAQDVGMLADEDVAALEANIDGVVQAEVAGDWATVGNFLADDFVGLPSGMPAVEGKSAWIDWVSGMDFKISDLSVKYLEIDGRGDLAYVRGTYSELMAMGDSEPERIDGKFLWIFKKQADGRWLATIGMGSSDAPEGSGGG